MSGLRAGGFGRLTALCLLMIAMIDSVAARVRLNKVIVTLDNTEVSKTTAMTLGLSRTTSGGNWEPDQCYQLFIESPYSEDYVYKSFDETKPPVCTSLTPDVEVESCEIYSQDRLNIIFKSFTSGTDGSETRKKIEVKITNFDTPFSSQPMNTLSVRYFSDKYCQKDQESQTGNTQTLQRALLPTDSTTVTTSSKVLGDSSSGNTLSVTFTPEVTLSPSLSGNIKIAVPNWYDLDGTTKRAYNDVATNKCSSDCMRIYSSYLETDIIMKYDQMLEECLIGKEIVINCRGYYNPNVPEPLNGFKLRVFDSEDSEGLIMETEDDSLILEATPYTPALIPDRNFILNPTFFTVATYSGWTMSLLVNIPMTYGCFIKWYLPVEFKYDQITEIYADGIFMKEDGESLTPISSLSLLPREDSPEKDKASVVFPGCFFAQSLGVEPQGGIEIMDIRTQTSKKTSGTFEIEIYKDKELTQLIAKLENGVALPGTDLQPGDLGEIIIKPTDYRVQVVTDLLISFTVLNVMEDGDGVEIRLPFDLSIPGYNEQANFEIDAVLPTGATVKAKVSPGNKVLIPAVGIAGGRPPGEKVILKLKGIKNQNSAKDAGDFEITVMSFVDGDYFVVDIGKSTESYVAVVGKIDAIGDIEINDPTNDAKDVIYTLTFTLEDAVPSSGYLKIEFPDTTHLHPSTTRSVGSCRVYTCAEVEKNMVKILFRDGLEAIKEHKLEIGGVVNPRSFKKTNDFFMASLDIDAVSPIDEGFKIGVTMQNAGDMSGFFTQHTSDVNGVIDMYTISFQTVINVIVTDKFQIILPDEMGPPATLEEMDCKALANIKDMTCVLEGRKIHILFNEIESGSQVFRWSISNIQNAASTKPSTLIDVHVLDSEDFVISSPSAPPVITNSVPADLEVYSIKQSTLENSALATYTLSFTPINPMSATGSVQITYPSKITMVDGSATPCKVNTEFGEFTDKCTVSEVTRLITLKGVFADNVGYKGPITITVDQVKNPANNKVVNGFVIQTYQDASQTYIQDKLGDDMLKPLFICDYPCATCDENDRTICTTCWTSEDTPKYLMTYPELGTASCMPYCDFGFTSNGKENLMCEACDVSCANCDDNGTPNDKFECIECSATHTFRKVLTNFCLEECTEGLFISTDKVCSECQDPCLGCVSNQDKCTSCHPKTSETDVWNLFQDMCVTECPESYVSMADVRGSGFCKKCNSPCLTCGDRPENCETCDSSAPFLYQERCYNSCPRGSIPLPTSATCQSCQFGCDLCDLEDAETCHKCTRPQISHQGKCVDQCPEGWHPNYPEDDGRACRLWKLGDAGTAPYPFLIVYLIFVVIILFGLMKRRAILSKGKMKWEFPQNTFTCLIVALAPIQFLATIAQWIFANIYGTPIFTILTLIVTFCAIIINIAFMINFIRRFDSLKIPMEYERRWRLGKMSKAEAGTHKVPIDDKFNLYKRQFKGCVYTVYGFSWILGFQCNMAFYSFFYDLKPFQAHFEKAKYYRKMLTWYLIAYIILVNLTTICIDITCLTMIENKNQLHITVVETLIFAIVSIILISIELYVIKYSLEYTEPKKDKLKFKSAKDSDDDSDSWEEYQNLDKKFDKGKASQRRLLMDDLLRHVKHNKLLFLNNKLDELLNAFGNRKCKSMLDLGTGWPLEDDPRLAITWPCSPNLREDYNEQMGEGFKFSKEDAFGVQGNNVYADVKSKFMGMDFGTQDDAGFLEFQDALNRKHGGLMSQQEGDLEERRMKRKNRRRGRKNKYYAQIDHEDDQEANMAEASDAEEHLQVIKEQEEEEENLRKAVQAEAAKQQQIAANRKKIAEEALAQKQAQEMAEADLRKKKAYDIEQTSLAEQKADVEKQLQQAKMSKQLQEEHLRERQQAEAAAKLKQEQLAKASATERAKYEKAEEERKVQLSKDQAAQGKVDADTQQKKLAQEKADRDKTLEQRNAEQVQRDQKELQNKKAEIINENQQRETVRDKQATLSPQLTETNQTIKMADTLMHDFSSGGDKPIDVPPRSDLRSFNENDILGELSRDEKGNVVVEKGQNKDKDGNLINPRGYLVDATSGAIVENQNFQQMFAKQELDERGEVPAPFSIERHNFNPHNLMGDFDYMDGKPELMQSKQGFFIDKKGRRVNKHGWMVLTNQGHLVDISGRKKFDKQQLSSDGDLPKLMTYSGRRFDIKDVMGAFEKDDNSKIRPQKQTAKGGYLIDLLGRRVSDKGYLIDEAGNVVDRDQKVIFKKCELKNGEFPKIFSFTKFNIKTIMGDFDTNANGQPQLNKGKHGGFVDKQKRVVNQRGYFIDVEGNIVDFNGNLVFEKVILGKDGEIPSVFRTGLLKDQTTSNMSELMNEIEQIKPTRRPQEEGETSMDSQMEDTPANYNQANQRFDGGNVDATEEYDENEEDDYGVHYAPEGNTDEDEADADAQGAGGKKRKSKKKKVISTVEVLPPTHREKNMAGAYGGQAVGSIRRPGIKYEKDRLKGSKTFRVNTAEEPKLRAKLTQLVKSASGAEALNELGQPQQPSATHQGLMGQTVQHESIVNDQQEIEGPDSGASQAQKKRQRAKPGMQDFEEIFGKDIDQFLEDSEWDVAEKKKN